MGPGSNGSSLESGIDGKELSSIGEDPMDHQRTLSSGEDEVLNGDENMKENSPTTTSNMRDPIEENLSFSVNSLTKKEIREEQDPLLLNQPPLSSQSLIVDGKSNYFEK